MTIKEFLTDINGTDVETRKPKSAITIQLQIVNLVTGKPTVVKSFSIHRPVVEAKKRGDFMELNLIFNDDIITSFYAIGKGFLHFLPFFAIFWGF